MKQFLHRQLILNILLSILLNELFDVLVEREFVRLISAVTECILLGCDEYYSACLLQFYVLLVVVLYYHCCDTEIGCGVLVVPTLVNYVFALPL